MNRRLTAAVGLLGSGLLLLTSCAADDPGRTQDNAAPFTVDVDVDTPELRRLKQQAGVEPCPEPGPGTAETAPEDALPDVTLPCLGGGPDVDLSTLRGPMVVNLWAQWCPPCREELPYYQELHERAGGKVAVLGVDYEDTRPELAFELIRETGVTYPLLADPGSELRVPLRVRGLPVVLFVDEKGSVVSAEYVVIRSFDQLAGLVKDRLGVTVGTAG